MASFQFFGRLLTQLNLHSLSSQSIWIEPNHTGHGFELSEYKSCVRPGWWKVPS
jgi:hypothetical protein